MTTEMTDLPDCGLYKTTKALPGYEEAVPADRLVYFHNHSDSGKPMVLMPASNTHNRWAWQEKGFPIDDLGYIESLVEMKKEGFYRVREPFRPNDREYVDTNQIVQLGYNPSGEPIVFFPKVSEDINALIYPNKGMKVPEPIYALLEPLSTRGLFVPKPSNLH